VNKTQTKDVGTQNEKPSDEFDQANIVHLLNNADPLELRKALDQDEIENLDKQIHDTSDD
jgi:hypothetical protein